MNESSVECESARQRGDCSGEKGVGLLGLVSPVGGERFNFSVVSCQSVDSGFNEDQSEFAVLVRSMLLDMLSDVDGLFEQSN